MKTQNLTIQKNTEKILKTYADIYDDFYKFDKKIFKYHVKIIKKNLSEMKIKISDLKRYNVFNVGTGLESYVFLKLGAKKVFHCDISKKAVNSVRNLKNNFSNIYTKKIDLCSENLVLAENIDIVYLSGVFHHFYNPNYALKNILKYLNYNGVIFIRNYRSGSNYFFTIDYIRKFFIENEFKNLKKMLNSQITKKFGKFNLRIKDWNNSYSTYLYNQALDHFRVPTLNLYSPNKFQSYFERLKFKNLMKKKYLNYDHKDYSKKNNLMISFIFKNKNKNLNFLPKFIEHVDQLKISYNEKYIKNTVILMKKNLEIIKNFDLKNKIKLLIDLIYVSNVYRYNKFYLKKKKKPFFSNVKKIHLSLQNTLNIITDIDYK